MDGKRWEALEARIKKLERENRWLRLGCLASCLAVGCIAIMGQARRTGDTLEAQRFVLTNAKGKMRAELKLLDGDYPALFLHTPDGMGQTEVSPHGISVWQWGLHTGNLPQAHLGDLGLYFTDARGRVVMEIGGAGGRAHPTEVAPIPDITIYDTKGNSIWRAP